MKIALVYDRVNKIGGAEKVLQALHEIWPEAPLYTAVYNPKGAPWAKDFSIRTSFLQKVPFAASNHELFPWLTPLAFEQFDFSDFDVVLSITSAEAKCCVTPPNVLHICYCLTPTRYLWSHKNLYEKSGLKGLALKLSGPFMRIQDFLAAQRVDEFLAISKEVKGRIKKYYQREAEVVYPPVSVSQQTENDFTVPPKPYYLIVSRLVSYKKVEIAIEAFNDLKKQLIIIGTGSEEKRLKKIAGPTITFTGQLTEGEVTGYYMHCRGVIFTPEEDFGIVPVEAQMYGKPVLAFSKGGAKETVIEEKTGVFFARQDKQTLKECIVRFEKMSFKQRLRRKRRFVFKGAV